MSGSTLRAVRTKEQIAADMAQPWRSRSACRRVSPAVMGLAEQDDPGGMCAGMTPERRKKLRRANRTAARRPVPVDPDGFKRCTQCKEVKPLTAFYVSGTGSDGRRANCAGCCRKLNRLRYRRDNTPPETAEQVAS